MEFSKCSAAEHLDDLETAWRNIQHPPAEEPDIGINTPGNGDLFSESQPQNEDDDESDETPSAREERTERKLEELREAAEAAPGRGFVTVQA